MSALSRRLMAGLVLSALPGLHAGAQQPWPNRPVRVVVGYPPGGAADVAARLVAAHLTEALGAPFVLDNRPGASTIIAAEAAAKAAPDGYTLLFGSQSTMASVPVLFSARAGYDPGRDFVPVGLVCRAPFFVFVSAASPDADLRALLDRARARPGALTYGSNGAGAAGHLATELLLRDAGLRMTHVPYRSYVPAFTDLAGGRLDMVLGDLTAAGGAVQAGRLRLLAAVSPQRSAFAPEVPTAAEAAGLPPFEAGAWFGLFAPRGTPDAAVAALSAALRDYLATERAHTAFTGIGLAPLFASPHEVTALVRSDTERFGRLIREQGITAEWPSGGTERWDAGASAEVPERGRLVVDCGGTSIGIFRLDGVLHAYENLCPHAGGPVCQGLMIPPGLTHETLWAEQVERRQNQTSSSALERSRVFQL